jgi:hypothetical protein
MGEASFASKDCGASCPCARVAHGARFPRTCRPKDLPPKSTLSDYFELRTYDDTFENIHHALYVRCREQIRRTASPTACVIDSHPWTSLSDCLVSQG